MVQPKQTNKQKNTQKGETLVQRNINLNFCQRRSNFNINGGENEGLSLYLGYMTKMSVPQIFWH